MVEYVLMAFFIINGQQYREERVLPDYRACIQEKQKWQAEAKRLWMKEAEAYCIAREVRF